MIPKFAFSTLKLSCVVLISLFACSKTTIPQATPVNNVTPTLEKSPKNIILMIGDGMGLGQISAGLYANGNKSALERMEYIGLHKPYAGNKLITDSAAAATAFACGVKTYNGAIGVDMDTIAVPSILEHAESDGMATGLIATSTIVHATPASFIAHDAYRKNYEAIAEDFLKTDIDLFIGGGAKFFNQREDEKDLYQALRNNGYQVEDYFSKELEDFDFSGYEKIAYLTAIDSPIPVAKGRDYLAKASIKALDYLKQKSAEHGFFIMIEGSQIDWGGHANNTAYLLSEMQEYDRVIGEVLDWSQADGETLVIVTADHETGGFAIQKESTMDSIVGAFTSDYHTGTMIPVFSDGPMASEFKGIYENTAIYDKMMKALSLSN